MAVQLTSEMINGAIATQYKYGVPASVTLAQIMLESGGNYPGGLSGLAYKDNNLFGIKAGSNWTGKTATYSTQEVGADGKAYTTKASFRKYNSVAESIDDHGRLLSSPTYTNKTAGVTNLNDYVHAMGSVYATNPTYADTLLSVINSNNLTKYDSMSYSSPQTNTAYTVTQTGIINGKGVFGSDLAGDIFTVIIRVVIILLIVIASIVFFMKAFNVSPTRVAKKVGAKVVKKKTGVNVEPALDMLEGETNE